MFGKGLERQVPTQIGGTVSIGNDHQTNLIHRPAALPILVGNGKLSLGSRSPAYYDHYQSLPAAAIKYTYMKTAFKVILIAIAMVTVCLAVHYAMGTFSY